MINLSKFYEEHRAPESYGVVVTLFDFDNGSFCRIKTNHPASICSQFFNGGGELLVTEKRTAKVIIFRHNGHIYSIPMQQTLASVNFAKMICKTTGYYGISSTMDQSAVYIFSRLVENLMDYVTDSKYFFNASNFMAAIYETRNWMHNIGK